MSGETSDPIFIEKIKSISQSDFMIIGAGPVGLQTAIIMAEYLNSIKSTGSKIYIFEKRNVFNRKQVLWMDTYFWQSINEKIKRYRAV